MAQPPVAPEDDMSNNTTLRNDIAVLRDVIEDLQEAGGALCALSAYTADNNLIEQHMLNEIVICLEERLFKAEDYLERRESPEE
jgi:hypothetical protein